MNHYLHVSMHHELIEIDREDFLLEEEKIYSHVAPGSKEADPHTADLIHTLVRQSLDLMHPLAAVSYTQAGEAPGKGKVAAGDIHFETGGTIAKMLRGSERYAFFIATAGPQPEALSRALLKNGEFLEGYIVDVIGSFLVEQVAEQVHQNVKDRASDNGWSASNRYSPGYCGWKVDEQQKLFSLFPDGSCGITLSASALMHPIKSVSGLIGMGKSVRFRDYTCELCSMTKCIYRQIRPGPAPVSQTLS